MNEAIKKLIDEYRDDCSFFNIDDRLANALEIAVEVLEVIENEGYAGEDREAAKYALQQIQAIAEGGRDEKY